jgi:hypothetical protein
MKRLGMQATNNIELPADRNTRLSGSLIAIAYIMPHSIQKQHSKPPSSPAGLLLLAPAASAEEPWPTGSVLGSAFCTAYEGTPSATGVQGERGGDRSPLLGGTAARVAGGNAPAEDVCGTPAGKAARLTSSQYSRVHFRVWRPRIS